MTRPALLLFAVLAAALGGASIHGGPLAPTCAQAAGNYQVALVVEHSDGEAGVRRCVSAAGNSGVAANVLDASGVPYRYVDEGSYGRAVCQVQNEPPGTSFDRNNCLGGSQTWSIFCSSPWRHLADGSDNPCFTSDGSWRYSSRGISSLQVRGGDAIGFKYEGNPDLPRSPGGICQAVAGDRQPSPAPSPAAGAPAADAGSPGQPAPARSSARANTAVAAGNPATPGSAPSAASTAGAGESPAPPGQADGLTALSSAPPPTRVRSARAAPAAGAPTAGAGAWLGRLAAVAAALVLVGGLGAQLLLPRLRR
jgi:hypothetical protein